MSGCFPDIINNIIGGSVSGIFAGLILAAFFWILEHYRKRSERAEQVKYISEMVMHFRKLILIDFAEDMPRPDGNEIVSVHEIRKKLYDTFQTGLESAPVRRSSRLTYDEIEMVRFLLFWQYSEVRDRVDLAKEWYVEKFKQAESLKWLNVAPLPQIQKSEQRIE